MKTNVQLYQSDNPNSAQIPNELANLREFAISYTVAIMRMFGVGTLTAKPAFLGIKGLSDVSFKPLTTGLPEPLAQARNFVVRQLAEFILLFGILEINIVPTDEEVEALKSDWEKITQDYVRPTAEQLAASQADTGNVEEIKLNIDEDPTGKKVTEDESEEDAGGDSSSEGGESTPKED